MHPIISAMSEDELRAVVTALDRIGKPLAQRFEGDDTPIVELMVKMGLPTTIVEKQLIAGLVIPHGN